jgi:hypothetical protein
MLSTITTFISRLPGVNRRPNLEMSFRPRVVPVLVVADENLALRVNGTKRSAGVDDGVDANERAADDDERDSNRYRNASHGTPLAAGRT